MSERNWGGSPPKPRAATCQSTTIKSEDVVVNGIPHAGTAVHICILEESDHPSCLCRCGMTWIKNFRGIRP